MEKLKIDILTYINSLRPELPLLGISATLTALSERNLQLFLSNSKKRFKCPKTIHEYDHFFIDISSKPNEMLNTLIEEFQIIFDKRSLNIHDENVREIGFCIDISDGRDAEGNVEKKIRGFFYFATSRQNPKKVNQFKRIIREDYRMLMEWDNPGEFKKDADNKGKIANNDDDDDFSDLVSTKRPVAASQPLVNLNKLKSLQDKDDDSDDFIDLPKSKGNTSQKQILQLPPINMSLPPKLPIKPRSPKIPTKSDSFPQVNRPGMNQRPSIINNKDGMRGSEIDFDFLNDPDYVPNSKPVASSPQSIRKGSMRVTRKSKFHTLELNSSFLAKSGLSRSQTKLISLKEDDNDDFNYS